ncbi:quinone oxidoreductase [Acetobacteraceae bacterium KSS8]|uniref:Quinone oxidoreductase n=1 Tax=Endosaccharibacter trunci TaxID=2812733 RepID=A0ABT1WAI4_9PROT|nr:quinone oxidoreductase [Acetobacteraceae bacterium KSS8]
MTNSVRVHAYGGPEALSFDQIPKPAPATGEILIRQEAMGVNFIDVYYRTGLYKLPNLPSVIGMEAAGIVERVGAEVSGIAVGDRVAYPTQLGAYVTHRSIAADLVVKLPDSISTRQAAAMMLRGLTVQALLRQVRALQPGDTILVHAAAGGVGLMLCQWAAHLGAEVIGIVSTEAKAERVRASGAAHVLVGYNDVPAQVRRITGGAMVPVVYDSVGKDTFVDSLDCLSPRGLMVSYGNASGEVTDVALRMLAARGSLYVTRPKLATFIGRPEQLRSASAELFDVVASGALTIDIGQQFPLSQTAEAHRALESRATVGSTILVPD